MARTLILVKPDAFARGLTGEIIRRFEAKGLRIVALNCTTLSEDTKELVRRALECSWSSKTSICYNPKIAPLSYGQCAPTAVVVAEMFGGEILKSQVPK